MNLPGPLRANLSRRCRKLPLDGRVAGIEYPRFRGRIERPIRTSEIAYGPGDTTYNNTPLPVIYDPGIGPYRFDTPEYDHPEPWHDTAAFGTPPPPGPAPNVDMQQHTGPPTDHDLAGWLPQGFVNDRSREPVHGNVDLHELFDPERTVRLKIGEIHDHCERIDAYESSVEVGNLIPEMMGGYADVPAGPDPQTPAFPEELGPSQVAEPLPEPFGLPGNGAMSPNEIDTQDAFSPQDLEAVAIGHEFAPETGIAGPDCPVGAIGLPDTGMDPISSAPEPTCAAPDQLQYGMPLEDIVEDEMQAMDPYGMIDPYHAVGPYGPLPDPRMMGMPMNPFGPMPPGLGPMGPMMGPGMGPMGPM